MIISLHVVFFVLEESNLVAMALWLMIGTALNPAVVLSINSPPNNTP
jgi:hypothetical protein